MAENLVVGRSARTGGPERDVRGGGLRGRNWATWGMEGSVRQIAGSGLFGGNSHGHREGGEAVMIGRWAIGDSSGEVGVARGGTDRNTESGSVYAMAVTHFPRPSRGKEPLLAKCGRVTIRQLRCYEWQQIGKMRPIGPQALWIGISYIVWRRP